MTEFILSIILAFLPALFIAFLATPVARRLAIRVNFWDEPNARKVHTTPVPMLGGLAIYFGVVIGLLIATSDEYRTQLVALLSGSTFIAIVGVIDDRVSLPPRFKLLVAIPLAALILVVGDLRVTAWPMAPYLGRYPLSGFVVSVVLTTLWVMVVTTAFAIIDHMDGLCAGIVVIASGFFLFFALQESQYLMAVLAASLMGSNLGFLIWNLRPASIFMGDAGALLVGFLIAALGILLKFMDLTPFTSWMIPPLVLGIPLLDLALVVTSRLRRGLRPSASPGKDHLAHRLSAAGLGNLGAVVTIYLTAIVFGAFAIVVTKLTILQAYSIVLAAIALFGFLVWQFEKITYERQEALLTVPNSHVESDN